MSKLETTSVRIGQDEDITTINGLCSTEPTIQAIQDYVTGRGLTVDFIGITYNAEKTEWYWFADIKAEKKGKLN